MDFIYIILSNVVGLFSTYVIFYFLSKFNRKIFFSRGITILVYVAFTVSVVTVNSLNINPLNIIYTIVAAVLIGHFLYNDEKIYIVYYILYMVVFLIFQYAFSLLLGETLFSNIYLNVLVLNVLTQIINLASTRFFLFVLKNKKVKDITIIQYVSFLIFPIFSVFYILTLMNFAGPFVEGRGKVFFLFCVISIAFFNIFIVNIFESISKNNELKREVLVYEQKSEMEFRYYMSLEDKFDRSRKFRHDMKNHIQTIQSLYKNNKEEEANNYANDIFKVLDSLGQRIYTENPVLNVILNDKVRLANNKGVFIDISIGDIDLSFMKGIDITTVFSNLIDNAIDSALESDEKRVCVKAKSFNEMIIISISNKFKNVKVINGEYKTTKKNHLGFGILNVKKILSEYNGSVVFKNEDDVFKVNIVIPKN